MFASSCAASLAAHPAGEAYPVQAAAPIADPAAAYPVRLMQAVLLGAQRAAACAEMERWREVEGGGGGELEDLNRNHVEDYGMFVKTKSVHHMLHLHFDPAANSLSITAKSLDPKEEVFDELGSVGF